MHQRLVDRSPRLSAAELAARFAPTHRFADVRFATFEPNPAHPSQAAARADLELVVAALGGGADNASEAGGRFRRRRPTAATATKRVRGRYLDGGFGVGKTHLLASAWHAAPGPKSFLTFEELTAFVGFVGMERAIATFRGHRLLCIDEFELDDVANTMMAVSFLRAVVAAGATIITTSNAVPDRLGEGRFNADDFTREIAAIAEHFDVLRIDGPDYRATNVTTEQLLQPGEIESLARRANSVTVDSFDDVLAHLRHVHPVHYAALLDGLDAVIINGIAPIDNQGAALLFVQLIDEIYDAGIAFGATGCDIGEIFPASYRRGGFRKKYGRCESRLGALVTEARV